MRNSAVSINCLKSEKNKKITKKHLQKKKGSVIISFAVRQTTSTTKNNVETEKKIKKVVDNDSHA